MNKKKTSTNLQSINKNSNLKKRNNDTNNTNNPSIDNSIDDSSKISEKSQTKKNTKPNTNNYTSLNINAPPYKSYRKHIDRKKNANGLYKHIRGNNEKINTSYTNKNNQSNTTNTNNNNNTNNTINNSNSNINNNSNNNSNTKRNETPRKPRKRLWSQNIASSSAIIKKFLDKYNVNLIELKKYAFDKISSLSKDIIFQNLLSIKKQINNLLDIINQQNKLQKKNTQNDKNPFDYNKLMLNFIEGLTKKVEINTNKCNEDDDNKNSNKEKLKTYKSNPSLVDLKAVEIMTKENGVSFEYPIYKKRSLSFKVEERLRGSRKSSEEISRRIQEKMDTAEKNREIFWRNQLKASNKINEKINTIKDRQKEEQKRKLNEIYNKLAKMGEQQKRIMNNKIQVVKNEHEKVAEINYIYKLKKENKDFNIMKKFKQSIIRRNQYLQERVNKTRRHYGGNITSTEDLTEDLREINITGTESNALDASEKKKFFRMKVDFLKKIFNENFIWELFEADYFDIDELVNISSLTKFELIKTKLRKEKETIDKLCIMNKNKKSSRTTTTGIINNFNNYSGTLNTVVTGNKSSGYGDYLDDENTNYYNNNDEYEDKKSRSFIVFNENDFSDIDYLFVKSKKKKKKNKKKKLKNNNKNSDSNKKNENNEEKEENEEIRKRLLRALRCNSMKEIRNVYYKEKNNENKITKYLVKTESSGKYIQSQLIVVPEDLCSINSNINNSINDNIILSKENNLTNSNINSINDIKDNSNNQYISQNSGEKDISNNYSSKSSNFKNSNEEKKEKEKIFHDIIQQSNLGNNNNTGEISNTITIKNDNLANILEKNQISIRWCKICNMILPLDLEPNTHIKSSDHQKLLKEYGLSMQEESNTIMLFKSIPGNINEELKTERMNAIKLREKKLKQKMALKAVKHENYRTYKQDFPSPNKQRIQKLSFEIEKQLFPNIKDYDSLESMLKELIKILDQKKQNDLNILRQTRVIYSLVEVLKKPASCHKSEMKSLGKVLVLILKILNSFSSLLENKNYMIVTNRISIIADLLLWVLNKPTKIPLGISFLPDLIQIITVHIKHRIAFECLLMKEDLLEYLLLSNIVGKFKAKYISLTGPAEITTGFGSFPLVLLKSLGMFETLTYQININYLTKPVYIKQTKISQNILYVFEYSELFGLIQLLSILLLSNGPLRPNEKVKIKQQQQIVISASLLSIKIINNICRIDLNLVQNLMAQTINQEQIQHVILYIICYSLEYLDTLDEIKELLHEVLLLTSYLSLQNERFQNLVSKGEMTIIQQICQLPFSYFSEKLLKDILFPTLITFTYNHERNTKILSNEINLELIVLYLKEKIQLEPIAEEEVSEWSSSITNENNLNNNNNLIKINRESFLSGNNDKNELINPRKEASTTSSAKSCHDMITGNSDFVTLSHRFPIELWNKAQEYYSTFGKKISS